MIPNILLKKNDEFIAAQFTDDNLWYRAQVLNVIKDEEVTRWKIRYIDFGNIETLGKDRIRRLPEKYFNVIEPQGHKGKLAYVKAPKLNSEYGPDSVKFLKMLALNKSLTGEVVRQSEDGVNHLIVRGKNGELINHEMLRNGLALVEKQKNKPNDEYKSMLEVQETAKEERVNLWLKGDPYNEEDSQ